MGWRSTNEPFVRHASPSLALTPNHSLPLTWDSPGHSGEIPWHSLSELPAVEHIWGSDGCSSHTTASPKDFSCLTGAKEPVLSPRALPWEPQCCPCSGILSALLALTPPLPFPLLNSQQAPFSRKVGSASQSTSHDGFIKLIIPPKASGPNLLFGFLFSLLSLLCHA